MKFEGKRVISIIKYSLREYKKSIRAIQKNILKPFSGLILFFRSYITVFAVIFLLSFSLIASSSSYSGSQNGSIMFGYLDGKGGNEENGKIIVKNIEESNNVQITQENVPIVKIASTDNSILMDFSQSIEEKEENIRNISEPISFALLGGNSFLAPAVYYDDSLEDSKYGIVFYEVVSGDTPSSIATAFGISTYTVLWANNLKVGDYIKPGQKLEILPVVGVKHIVKSGDTVETIATKYKAETEEIIIFNNLPADGIFPEGSENKVLIIPNGELAAPLYAPKPTPRRTSGQVVSSSRYSSSRFYNPLNSHRFAYGHCTYYVASKVYVPWSGDAKYWLRNARAYGYKTGNTPVIGSIVVTSESRRYGHVAFVESVSATSITVSEMNYVAWNRKSVRVLSRNSAVIRGYIYMN